MMSSSNNDILTDWESACERESFVLSSYLKFVLVDAGGWGLGRERAYM